MKKGFTLMEVLAVLVVIAIIAIIAIPQVINIIKSSKDSLNKRSVENYAKAIETMIKDYSISGATQDLEGTYHTGDNKTIVKNTGEKTYKIDYTGNNVVCEKVKIYPDGTVYLNGCTVGNSTEIYDFGPDTEEYYSNYTPYDSWDVSEAQDESIMATLYDNAQFGGNTGEYTLVFTGSGDIFYNNSNPFFQYKSNITKLEFLEGIVSISSYYFNRMDKLIDVDLPNSLVTIEPMAFEYCTNLSSIILPNSLVTIGQMAFQNCTNLSSIVIPDSVTSIGELAFHNCTNLSTIITSNNIERIGRYAFDGTEWIDNQLDGLIYIGKVLYSYKGTMPDSTSITVREGTKQISRYAFYGQTSLISIIIPNSVTDIGDHAFSGCSNLTIYYKGTATGSPWGATGATVVTDFQEDN